VAVGDFNNDGIPDIVTSNGDGTVSVLLGQKDKNGALTFAKPISSPAGPPGMMPLNLLAYDFDGDGTLDLAVTLNPPGPPGPPGSLAILFGNGDGTFRAPGPDDIYRVGGFPLGLAMGDLTRSGTQDLVVSNYFSSSVSVLLGNGDGSFQQAVSYTTVSSNPEDPPSIFPSDVTLGDFYGDGNLSIAVSNLGPLNGGFTVSILRNNGNGTFGPPTVIDLGRVAGANHLVAADVDGDGSTDLVVSTAGQGSTPSSMVVLLGNGDGTFQEPILNPVATPGSLALADFEQTGNLDVAVTITDRFERIAVLSGNGDGTLNEPTYYPTGPLPVSLAVSDLNGDGFPALIVANNGDDTVAVLYHDFGSSRPRAGAAALELQTSASSDNVPLTDSDNTASSLVSFAPPTVTEAIPPLPLQPDLVSHVVHAKPVLDDMDLAP
jgi:hypothetical protein